MVIIDKVTKTQLRNYITFFGNLVTNAGWQLLLKKIAFDQFVQCD